ncbi:uncharacterized protein TNCV_1259971 [Trichonephila clavipes]|nr:uncharacterized protein TNCV_1259971 [Trichonephila clavipes]
MITNVFIPELNNHDVQELWFQQDGATCHTARATIYLLKETFGDRLISRFGPVNWPPRSCDLTPLDYFLWGYVKSLVYADKPQTLDHLEDDVRRVVATNVGKRSPAVHRGSPHPIKNSFTKIQHPDQQLILRRVLEYPPSNGSQSTSQVTTGDHTTDTTADGPTSYDDESPAMTCDTAV